MINRKENNPYDLITLTRDLKGNIEYNKDLLYPYELIASTDTAELFWKDEQGNLVNTNTPANEKIEALSVKVEVNKENIETNRLAIVDNQLEIAINRNNIEINKQNIIQARTEIVGENRISDKSISSSKLKIATNEDRIKPENLSEEVIAMMTGTTPVGPTLDDNSVTTSKIADGAVTFSKLAYRQQPIFSWKDTTVVKNDDGSLTITFLGDVVLQSQSTGHFVYFEGVGTISYNLQEGDKLYIDWNEETTITTTDTTIFKVDKVAVATRGVTLYTFVSDKVFENISFNKKYDRDYIFWGSLFTTKSETGLNVEFVSSAAKTFQDVNTGNFVYSNQDVLKFDLLDGEKLVLKNDFRRYMNKVDDLSTIMSIRKVNTILAEDEIVVCSYIGGVLFENIRYNESRELSASDIFSWRDFELDGNTIKFPSLVIQSLANGQFYYYPSAFDITVNDGELLYLEWNKKGTIKATDTSALKVANINSIANLDGVVLFMNIGNILYSNINTFNNKLLEYYSPMSERNKNKTTGFLSWREFEIINGKISFNDLVLQSYRNGNFYYYNGTPFEIDLEEGHVLYLDWQDSETLITQDNSLFKSIAMTSMSHIPGCIPLITRIGGIYYSEITTFNNYLQRYYNPAVDNGTGGVSLRVQENFKKLTPKFYKKLKKLDSDVVLVHLGDSISTNNYYTSQREDAKFRPPMMTEYCYPSYLEETLRPSGQEYRRYDVDGLFTEVGTGRNAEYDEFWDWVNTPSNNRPSWTRILEGTNCSVSYTIPLSACRCDYIYRTDCKNADNFTVAVSKGFGFVKIFDETTNNWVEANGYIISAKEDENWVGGQQVRKSINQKRLKMKVDRTINDGTIRITISNNGTGRLTYWGIQYSHREFMFDYLLQARGGHSISRIETFESWDVDYFKPDMILQQTCMLNENMDIANADGTAKDMGANTPEAFAERFRVYSQKLLDKPYAPELIAFSMWWGTGNNPLDPNTDEVWYGYSGEEKIAVVDYFNEVDFMYNENNINHFNLFNILWQLAKEKATKEKTSILTASTNPSGINGNTWTIDGGHLNNRGSHLVFNIMSNVFI